MPKDVKKKPIYETPVVVDLGELSKSLGQSCADGSMAGGPGVDCMSGNLPEGNCNVGGSVGVP